MRKIHGFATEKGPTYRTWQALRQRCNNPKNKNFPSYGGRGIFVDKRWDSFQNFLEDMGEKPKYMSIERIDNDGPYSPENCKWGTVKEQNNNKSNVRLVEYEGETTSIAVLSQKTGIDYSLLHHRIFRNGMSVYDAVNTPQVPHVKMNVERAEEVRRMVAGGMMQKEVAPIFNISRSVVSKICLGLSWSEAPALGTLGGGEDAGATA